MKKRKITIQEAKKIRMEEYLESVGIAPAKRYKGYGMYHADEDDSTASLKVDYNKNLYCDFRTEKGGDIISLVQLINKCSVSEALTILSQNINHFSFHKQTKNLIPPSKEYKEMMDETLDKIENGKLTFLELKSAIDEGLQSGKSNLKVSDIIRNETKREKNYMIKKVKPLQHKALIDYLISRKIDEKIAKKYCKEIHYELNSKKYFAIAFENDKNGFEIRNKYYQGTLKSKEISTIKNDSHQVAIFEGFVDFLSFKTIYKKKSFHMDYIILNSVSKTKNILSKIKDYEKVFCYLDNDLAGRNATKLLLENHKKSMDFSFIYQGYNDLNEYLMKQRK